MYILLYRLSHIESKYKFINKQIQQIYIYIYIFIYIYKIYNTHMYYIYIHIYIYTYVYIYMYYICIMIMFNNCVTFLKLYFFFRKKFDISGLL